MTDEDFKVAPFIYLGEFLLSDSYRSVERMGRVVLLVLPHQLASIMQDVLALQPKLAVE